MAHQGETDPALSDVRRRDHLDQGRRAATNYRCVQKRRRQRGRDGGRNLARAPAAIRSRPTRGAMAMLSAIGRFSDDAVLRAVAARNRSRRNRGHRSGADARGCARRAGLAAGPAPSPAQLEDLRVGLRCRSTRSAASTSARWSLCATASSPQSRPSRAPTRPCAARRTLMGKGLVVAKAAKPGQDLRFDRPAIGPATIELLAEIGAAMIGVEAGQCHDSRTRAHPRARRNALGVTRLRL